MRIYSFPQSKVNSCNRSQGSDCLFIAVSNEVSVGV